MKQIIHVSLIGAFVLGLSAAVFAQIAEIRRIDAYVRSVEAAKNKRPDLVFADVSDYTTNEKAKWRKFGSEKALDKHRESSEAYTIAYVWRKGGKLNASNFTLSSPSGDWVKYVYHYFREDGTLARVESDYRTFNGDFMVVRRRYFDRAGKQIKNSVKFLDLKTRKSKDASSGVMGVDPEDLDYYLSTNKLPFADLLNARK